MKLILLTGGIATGKSTVCRTLKALGAAIIDGDLVAREIVVPGLPAWQEIIQEFGEEILLPDRTLDRKALADRVFSDAASLQKLISITHPRIYERMLNQVEILKKQGEKLVILDIPLFLENPYPIPLDGILVAYAPREMQITRIMARDGLSREEALKRIENQMSTEEKAQKADWIIYTTGSLEDTKRQVDALWEKLISPDPPA
jgi:dephospho-CoA kinase